MIISCTCLCRCIISAAWFRLVQHPGRGTRSVRIGDCRSFRDSGAADVQEDGGNCARQLEDGENVVCRALAGTKQVAWRVIHRILGPGAQTATRVHVVLLFGVVCDFGILAGGFLFRVLDFRKEDGTRERV